MEEEERVKFLSYQRGVGAVFIKRPENKKWALLDYARPDVLVATKETYTYDQVQDIEKQFKCQVVILDRMLPTSSASRARAMRAGLHLRNDQRAPLRRVIPCRTTSAFLYLPVLHAGYVAFLTDPDPALDHVFLVGRSFEEDFPVLRKEIRALEPETAARLVRTLLPDIPVSVVETDDVAEVFPAPAWSWPTRC